MPAIRRRRVAGEKKLAPTTSCSSILEEIILQKWKRTFGAFLFCKADEFSFLQTKGSRKRRVRLCGKVTSLRITKEKI